MKLRDKSFIFGTVLYAGLMSHYGVWPNDIPLLGFILLGVCVLLIALGLVGPD